MPVAGNLGAELHIQARLGSTVGPFTTTWRDENNAPIDLAGASFESIIHRKTDSNPIDAFDVSLTGNPGEFSFVLPYTRCALLPADGSLCHVMSVIVGGQKIPLFGGSLILKVF